MLFFGFKYTEWCSENKGVSRLPGLVLPTVESDVAEWKFSRPVADNLAVHLGKGTNADQAPALLHVWLPRMQVNCWCGTFLHETPS